MDAYDQSGDMIGTVTIAGEEGPKLLMFGGRLRTTESPFPEPLVTKATNYLCYMKDGDYFHIYEVDQANSKTPYRFGSIVHSNSIEKSFESVTLNDEDEPGEIEGSFVRRSLKFNFHVDKPSQTSIFEKSDFAGRKLQLSICQVQMNGDQGNMLILSHSHEDVKDYYARNSIIYEEESNIRATRSLVLSISEPACCDVLLTGGKGSSLAHLTRASLENDPFEFKVPCGVVLTTAAYEQFLSDNGVRQLLSDLKFHETVCGQIFGDVQELCKRAVSEISKKLLSHKIEEQLEEKLRESFQSDIGNMLFAVRSSAAGEDSEDLSAAGQMDTFLGVRGLEEINQAIIKCWASQFSYTAVQYKRQNGQELNSPMAVVVQQLVPAEQAGVMFMSDPLTGNPSLITITANYGLGESVVSASADPDTIVIEKDVHGQIKLKNITLGGKAIKTVLSDNGGVKESSVLDSESGVCCLSVEKAEKLAKLGIKVEEIFGCPLDIEWATLEDQIYFLQARPITTFDKETDTEIIHEHDVFMRSHADSFSKANVGEVMPGAMTHLGLHFMFKLLDLSMQHHWSRKDPKNEANPYNPYLQRGIVASSNHVFFSLEALYRFEAENSPKKAFTSAYEIALFGRVLDNEELVKRAVKMNKNYPQGGSKIILILILLRVVYDYMMGGRHLRQAAKIVHNYKMILDENQSSEEYFEEMLGKIFDISKYGLCHSMATFGSVAAGVSLLSVLGKGNGDRWDETVYGDFAALLSSCQQVESADVPSAINLLSGAIISSIEAKKFCDISPELALEWLLTSETEAGKNFRDFLHKHGHRCVKEFDVYTKPWGTDPLPLVKTLQVMVRTCTGAGNESKKQTFSKSELLSKLKTPLTWKRRLILKFLVPQCQKAVGHREQSKSVLIRIMDHFRKKFCILADKMVKEGRLPEKDLLYFLSPYEISVLLKTRSSKLLQKAVRRKNLHKEIESYRFPEIIDGLPEPVNRNSTPQVVEGSLIMKGTPVSQGVVTGPVRVATNLEEASLIQPGEILIAYSTDIGWSPFFPMLIGVATELGGLVSHGAVVAREYGLPCVVSLHGATNMFRSGDMAILDGNKGILQRIDSDTQS